MTVSSVPSNSSFVCGVVAPLQSVAVLPGYLIGACLPSSNAIALLSDVSQDMLRKKSSALCDLGPAFQVELFWTARPYLLHVYADIGKTEIIEQY